MGAYSLTIFLHNATSNMTLIKSISGIRGTIGGPSGDALTPLDIVKFSSAFAQFIKDQSNKSNPTLIIGRDARISGEMVNRLVIGSLQGMGVNVIDCGLSTTPTVEVLVAEEKADGGIILTASHNPKQWNALKLLNAKGEFISGEDGKRVLEMAEDPMLRYAEVDDIGSLSEKHDGIAQHIDGILNLPTVNRSAIAAHGFKVAIDPVNSSGAIAIPPLLDALEVNSYTLINGEPNGHFAHNPEPLAENLVEICEVVKQGDYDMGIVVDPDVDRLAFIDENGVMFGEEYTLVAVADYLLEKNGGGNTVSNLSSTRALRDVTNKHGGSYTASAVGEVNVVNAMKATDALIGGEGNGGIIYPASHYGRDALVGIALFLSLLSERKTSLSNLKAGYPQYAMSKNKIALTPTLDIDDLLNKVHQHYANQETNTVDGLKIDFAEGWVHLRKSNTEPIVRVYSEGSNDTEAKRLAQEVMQVIEKSM